jgi:hypothetical protein
LIPVQWAAVPGSDNEEGNGVYNMEQECDDTHTKAVGSPGSGVCWHLSRQGLEQLGWFCSHWVTAGENRGDDEWASVSESANVDKSVKQARDSENVIAEVLRTLQV